MELVESRRYFRCRHCGTYHFSESVAGDGIRVTGHPADAPKCPICRVGMAHALLDDDHPVDFCAKCRGVLMPRATFAVVVNKRRAWAAGPPAEPIPIDHRELHRELTCPQCGNRCDTYPHLGPGSVVIDNCTRCDRIWLDFGEMKQMVDAPGRDRGSRQAPRVESYVRRPSMAEAPPSALDDPLGFLVEMLRKT